MNKVISCCGMVCSDCKSFPNECKGCPEIKGIAYWLQYVDADHCPIYDCCINDKRLNHCGECALLPCDKWYQFSDPTMSEEESKLIDSQRIELLKSL